MKYSVDQIQEALISKGYKWFESGFYNLNIVGIRNSSTENRVTNKFDDTITLSYKIDNKWNIHQYKCTTDPGIYWVENLLNPNGVVILKPGQYRSSHKIGLHQGKYKALKQKTPLKVYRDGDKDKEYDLLEENIHQGIYGINIHRATSNPNRTSTQVDKWSAGCQVIASYNDFKEFMDICEKSSLIWGNSFTYTLLESKDL